MNAKSTPSAPTVFAHRGSHAGDADENTLAAFRHALRRCHGFECDVRWSKDGVPFIMHDATLWRTLRFRHPTLRRTDRVSEATARALTAMGVPTLADALNVLQESPNVAARAVMDLKEQPVRTIAWILRRCNKLGLSKQRLMFLVWEDVAEQFPRTWANLDICRARESRFADCGTWAGVACKYTGTAVNHGCIRRALACGQRVNLYSPNAALHKEMLREYGAHPRCTFTL